MASALATSTPATSGYPQISTQQALAAYRGGRQMPTAQPGTADISKLDPKIVASARAAAQDFEAFFITHSFSEMASDIQPDEEFGGGEGESIFQSMLYNEYGKLAAKSQGVGIADQVARELLHLQELPPHE